MKEVSLENRSDAIIFAALQGLYPVEMTVKRIIVLLTREQVMQNVTELQKAGKNEEALRLLSLLDFNGDVALESLYGQIGSKSVRISGPTMYQILERTSSTFETRNDFMKRILVPKVMEYFNRMKGQLDFEKSRLIHELVDEWRSGPTSGEHETPEVEERSFRHIMDTMYEPFLRSRLSGDRIDSALPSALRRYRKNLLRLLTLNAREQFFWIPPSVLDRHIDMLIPEVDSIELEISPRSKKLRVLFQGPLNTVRTDRETDSAEEFEQTAEFLVALHSVVRSAADDRLYGTTDKDDEQLRRAYSRPLNEISKGRVTREESLDAIRKISGGIEYEFMFPFLSTKRETRTDTNGSVTITQKSFDYLDFALDLTSRGTFLLDRIPVEKAQPDGISATITKSIEDFSQAVLKDNWTAVTMYGRQTPDEVSHLIESLGKGETNDKLRNELMIRIAVGEFVQSVDALSKSMAVTTARFLSGSHVLTFTCPKILMAFINQTLESQDIESMIQEALLADSRGSR